MKSPRYQICWNIIGFRKDKKKSEEFSYFYLITLQWPRSLSCHWTERGWVWLQCNGKQEFLPNEYWFLVRHTLLLVNYYLLINCTNINFLKGKLYCFKTIVSFTLCGIWSFLGCQVKYYPLNYFMLFNTSENRSILLSLKLRIGSILYWR